MAHDADVLLVEDDEAIREAVCELLQDEGLAVQTAKHGGDAAQLLEGGMRPRLILLDLMMPVMDGWQFMQLFRDHPSWAQIPVVVVSASMEPPPLGAAGAVGKPLDIEQLLQLVGPLCGTQGLAPEINALTSYDHGCGLRPQTGQMTYHKA